MDTVFSAFDLVKGKLLGWLEQGILLLPNALVALLILLFAYILAIGAGKTSRRVLGKFLKNVSLVRFLGALTRLVVLLVGLLVALNVLQLDRAVLSLLTGVGILGIALGFAFQDMAANFISGVALVFHDDRPFKVGDVVETNGQVGVVKEINLRASTVETFQGQWVFIPNKQIFQESVINYSIRGERRIDLEVGISYGDDLEKVKKVTLEAVTGVTRVDTSRIDLFYQEFGDSSINFVVRFWVPFVAQTDFLSARSDAIMRIKAAFDQNDITIPFPIRTLDFGIKGGKTLKEMGGGVRSEE